MRKTPAFGPDLMTYVWIGISFGGLVGLASIGYVLEHFGPFFPSLIAAICASFILFPSPFLVFASPQSTVTRLYRYWYLKQYVDDKVVDII